MVAQPQIITPQNMQQFMAQGQLAQIMQTPDGQTILYQQPGQVQSPQMGQVSISFSAITFSTGISRKIQSNCE